MSVDDLERAERMVAHAEVDYMVLKRNLDSLGQLVRHLPEERRAYLRPKMRRARRELKTGEALLEEMRGQLRDLQRSTTPE